MSGSQQEQREKQIGIVLGLLEEAGRKKDWIIREMKKQNLAIQTSPSLNSYDILALCPTEFISSLVDALRSNDIVIPDGIPTKTYHWFFSDIVAGSNPSIPTNAQVKKITVLNDLISKTEAFKTRDHSMTIILPTGDGMAIGFGDSPERPVLLSIQLYKELARYNETKRGDYNKLLLRIGLDSGPVYFVKDLEGKDNVWGRGIIQTRRVMDLCGDMQIFAAANIAEELVRISPKYKEMLHHTQTIQTKYGEKIHLFNLYGDKFGLETARKTTKKAGVSGRQQTTKVATAFSFNTMEIRLDVTDLKTMATHHTWIWDITNQTKETRTKIFYFIDGQVPKDFSKLNIKVTGPNRKKLKIDNVSGDKPLRKEFHVLFDKPLLPKQQIRLELEYDWEMPERIFTYRFPSQVKRFHYICTLPRKIDIKSRILKVDLDIGYKIHASPPPAVKTIGDKIAITWDKSNILAQDAYQFQW